MPSFPDSFPKGGKRQAERVAVRVRMIAPDMREWRAQAVRRGGGAAEAESAESAAYAEV